MTDRDRLAADLHPITCWNNEFGCGGPADHLEEADSLIALGWTRLDEDPHLCLACGAMYGVPPTLDVEDGHQHPNLWCEPCVAHGIAIAPRGDPIGICQLRCGHDGPHDTTPPPLDEERLARALVAARWDRFYTAEGLAANAAKAYREDTDA